MSYTLSITDYPIIYESFVKATMNSNLRFNSELSFADIIKQLYGVQLNCGSNSLYSSGSLLFPSKEEAFLFLIRLSE